MNERPAGGPPGAGPHAAGAATATLADAGGLGWTTATQRARAVAPRPGLAPIEHRTSAVASSRAVLGAAFVVCASALLFGDYLALSASRALTGQTGNWLLCAALLQGVLATLALLLGRLRGITLLPEVWCFLALGAVGVAHFVFASLDSRGLGDYGNQKLFAHLALSGPALLCGIALGRNEDGLRLRWLLVFAGPLLVMAIASLLIDADRLTIAYYNKLHVYVGLLVMPAHQALAFVLGKCALAVHAIAQARGVGRVSRATRPVTILLLGTLTGLVLSSGARGYLVALIGAFAVSVTLGRRQVLLGMFALIACYAAFVWIPNETVSDRLDVSKMAESVAYTERREAWGIAWHALQADPLLGCGPGGFADLNAWSYRSYPHNLFLEVGAEFGLIGLLALAAVLGCSIRRIHRMRKSGTLTPTQHFAIGFFVFALLGAMTVGDLIRNHFLWMAIGLVATAGLRSDTTAPVPTGVRG